jgi:hypothetical protein
VLLLIRGCVIAARVIVTNYDIGIIRHGRMISDRAGSLEILRVDTLDALIARIIHIDCDDTVIRDRSDIVVVTREIDYVISRCGGSVTG